MKLLLTTFILLLVAFTAPAQITSQRIEEDPRTGASIFRPYFHEDEESGYTPAPEGYEALYISHFGRHGSRYYSQPKTWQQAIDCFSVAHAKGMLTPKGDSLYSAMKKIYDAHNGMYGELSPLGADEHRQIARRMFDRDETVFRSVKRHQVRCISSVYSRCLLSMANFTEELSSLAPDLEVSYMAGKRYNDLFLNSPIEYDFNKDANRIIDSLKRADLDYNSLFFPYFKNTYAAVSVHNPYEVEMGIFYFWAICFDLDFLGIDLTDLVPLEELAKCSRIDNAAKYAKVAVSEEFGKYTRIKGVNLLKDFMEKADDALKQDSEVAADLRFAHDSAFLPLCTLLGIPGYPICTIEEAYRSWNAADAVPMCSNLQMIFYKGKKDILVKVLVNERETVLDGLAPVQGIFYHWTDIRNMIEGLEDPDNINYDMKKSQNNQLYE